MPPRYLHTMLRISDATASLAFYEALGMELRRVTPLTRDGATYETHYFLGFPGQDEVLELTCNEGGREYEPATDYGHIAIGVYDLDETLAWLKEKGIEPRRPPYRSESGDRAIALVRDPDSYIVELIAGAEPQPAG